MELQGVPVIITGGASGLGEGAARVFAAAGAKVTLLDLQIEKAQALAEELGGLAISCNVA
ncbi:MAG: SDR family NAD(P)-dependent oxidoreductase, partial [Pseudomonadales bacterium]|nr:SDR family NAD(P)-dependent oxidoreductase [Pseudomonadales bacterium]